MLASSLQRGDTALKTPMNTNIQQETNTKIQINVQHLLHCSDPVRCKLVWFTNRLTLLTHLPCNTDDLLIKNMKQKIQFNCAVQEVIKKDSLKYNMF